MNKFKFDIIKKDKRSRARAGIIHTRHGKIKTPYLIPVATRGFIIALTDKDINKIIKPQALLANTYHLHFKQNKLDEKIAKQGGLHKYMKFKGPIVTDSGGFQAFSLGLGKVHNVRKIGFIPNEKNKIDDIIRPSFAKVTERGVKFKSVYDEKWYLMSPKDSMKIQSNLGADIIMAFDECTSPFSNKSYTKKAVERTHRWTHLCLKHRDPKQALYGIIQGGEFKDLRTKSARYINKLPFDGIAVGGSLGKTKDTMGKILDWIIPLVDDRPRHMLGIGWIEDLFICVERGMDTFDCVEMTRVARHGQLYISPKSGGTRENKFKLKIERSIYEKDKKKIDASCRCACCKKYNRAQLREMFKANDPEYRRVATIHNITFMQNLAKAIRESILKGTFHKLKKNWMG